MKNFGAGQTARHAAMKGVAWRCDALAVDLGDLIDSSTLNDGVAREDARGSFGGRSSHKRPGGDLLNTAHLLKYDEHLVILAKEHFWRLWACGIS